MDPLNEIALLPEVASILLWIKIIEVCMGVLFALAVLTLLVTWVRQLHWRVRASALVPLVAGIAAGLTAHALHETYVYWVNVLLQPLPDPGHLSAAFLAHLHAIVLHNLGQVAGATQVAAILGCIFVVVTGVLLVLGLLGARHLVVDGRHRPMPAQFAGQA